MLRFMKKKGDESQGYYYSSKQIVERAKEIGTTIDYFIIFGERSNGKTFDIKARIVEEWFTKGTKGVIMRRKAEEIKGRRAKKVFNDIVSSGKLAEITNGEYRDIDYYGGAYRLISYDDEGKVTKKIDFCYNIALSTSLDDKSVPFDEVGIVLFDEFMSRTSYLHNEFSLFLNAISTIVRDEEKRHVDVFMLGNTVSKHNPYFDKMHIPKLESIEKGEMVFYNCDIEYKDGEEKIATIAVERCESVKEMHGGKKSDRRFKFQLGEVNMIVDGEWDIPQYPTNYTDFRADDIKFKFYMCYSNQVVCGMLIGSKNGPYIHFREVSDMQINALNFDDETSKEFLFEMEFNNNPRKMIHFGELPSKLSIITKLINNNKVSFDNNDVGEIVVNYLSDCREFGFTNL